MTVWVGRGGPSVCWARPPCGLGPQGHGGGVGRIRGAAVGGGPRTQTLEDAACVLRVSAFGGDISGPQSHLLQEPFGKGEGSSARGGHGQSLKLGRKWPETEGDRPAPRPEPREEEDTKHPRPAACTSAGV